MNSILSNYAFDLLIKDVESFNKFRLEKLEVRLNFQGKALKNIKIPGALLVNIELQKVRFEESDLSDAIFSGSDLSDALILNCVAVKSVFGVPELIDANLDLDLQKLLLIPPNLYQTKFFGTDLSWSTFRNAHLDKTNFKWAYLEQVDFRSSDYEGALFEYAQFDKSIFGSADKIFLKSGLGF